MTLIIYGSLYLFNYDLCTNPIEFGFPNFTFGQVEPYGFGLALTKL